MNIETANRLYELRKKYGFSQEELAAKLGLSRQAVSKWERAEASPDTDNLVELAKLYGISLDDLLNISTSSEYLDDNKVAEEEVKENNDSASEEGHSKEETNKEETKKDDDLHIHLNDGNDSIHLNGKIDIEDGKDKVHINKQGIHVQSEDGDEVHIGLNGIHIKSKDDEVHFGKDCHISHHSIVEDIVMPLVVFGSLIAYLLLGFFLPNGMGWKAYWVLFLLIPIVGSTISAIKKRKFTDFCYPVLVVAVYCFIGIRLSGINYTMFGNTYTQMWHPWWFLFLTIPVYYAVFDPIDKAIRRHRRHTSKNIYFDNVIDNEEDD